jgi:streptogramin lyase
VEGSSLWVLDAYDRLIELDRQSGRKLREIKVTGEPREVTAGEGALWVTLYSTSELARVDPATGEVTRRAVARGPIGVVTEAGRVWVASHDASVVTPFAP